MHSADGISNWQVKKNTIQSSLHFITFTSVRVQCQGSYTVMFS